MPAGSPAHTHSTGTFLVGGAVRDALLGLEVKDRDWVVVGSSPQQMLDAGFIAVGKDFPVFLHPSTQEEYALARTERKTAPGYQRLCGARRTGCDAGRRPGPARPYYQFHSCSRRFHERQWHF